MSTLLIMFPTESQPWRPREECSCVFIHPKIPLAACALEFHGVSAALMDDDEFFMEEEFTQ